VVDEDASQTPLAHDVRPRPQGRVEAVEDAEQLAGRPSIVCEQEADLFGQHHSSCRASGWQRARS
jgi:hypothetical protein